MPCASRRALLAGSVLCFFTSGLAGLLYEVVWTRLLGLVFGHTVYAITTVLVAYMGGLALGSLWIGRRADRLERPLRVYALLEAAVGAYCLLTPWLFRLVDTAYVGFTRAAQPSTTVALAVQFAMAAAVLVVPTTLMGGTLPVLSRALVDGGAVPAARVGALYATNTWGAVAGTLLTGFVLLPAIGLRATVGLGVALNVAVAVVAYVLDLRAASVAGAVAAPAPRAPPEAAPADRAPALLRWALVATAVSGAASMAYELAWTRALSLVLGSSTYAFTAMLATFLLGLALGAFVASRVVARRAAGFATFAYLELAIALVTLAFLPAFGWLPEAALAILGRIGVTHAAALTVQFGLSVAVMIVPTLLIGATLPLVIASAGRGLATVGRDVGVVYGWNTLGCIVGSVAAGFLLVPTLGIEGTVRAASGANLIAGGLLLVAARPRGRTRLVPAAAALAFVLLALLLPRWDPRLMTAGVAVYAKSYLRDPGAFRASQQDRAILSYADGISATVVVERTNEVVGVRTNGKVDASNATDMPTQLLVGHLGALLHPAPRRALIIGMASGVTVGALATHPVEHIDVAELEPAMADAARFFERENRRVLADPRLRVVLGDGRHVLASAPEPYDIIVSEPSNPWIAGIASLFTREFYDLARSRLAPGGVVVQWLQGYNIFTEDARMVVRTFREIFPHVTLWTAAPGDFILVGTQGPQRIDLAQLRSRLDRFPGLREDFDRFRWHGEGLLARFELDEEGTRAFAEGAPLNSDDRPLLEFRAPLALYGSSLDDIVAAMRQASGGRPPPVAGTGAGALRSPAALLRRARADWFAGWPTKARQTLHDLDPSALGLEHRAERGRLFFLLGDFADAAVALRPVVAEQPGRADLARYLRASTSFAGRVAPEKLRDACLDACKLGDLDYCHLSRDQLEPELAVSMSLVTPLNNYAGVLYRLGDVRGALSYLRRSLEIDRSRPDAHYNVGLMHEKLGESGEALASYRAALQTDPAYAPARQRIAALEQGLTPPTAAPPRASPRR